MHRWNWEEASWSRRPGRLRTRTVRLEKRDAKGSSRALLNHPSGVTGQRPHPQHRPAGSLDLRASGSQSPVSIFPTEDVTWSIQLDRDPPRPLLPSRTPVPALNTEKSKNQIYKKKKKKRMERTYLHYNHFFLLCLNFLLNSKHPWGIGN